MAEIHAAAIQLNAGSDKRLNVEKAESMVRTAAGRDARLVVLPEVFCWRGPQADEPAIAEPIPGPTIARLAALTRALGIYLVAGSIHEAAGDNKVFNTSVLLDPQGEIVARYRKLHLFDIDLVGQVSIRESAVRRPGDEPVVAPTPFAQIGMTICYDLRFPELYRRLTIDGARIIVVPSAFTFATGSAHWEVLLRARAIENQVYIIAANQIGAGGEGIPNYGNSMIVDPWGKVLARAADRETVVYADLDLSYQDKVRRDLPCLQHRRL